MRLSRLTIDAGTQRVSLDLHPRLTVVAGIDERGRTALTTELLGALGSDRSGLTLELAEDRGRRLRIERPRGGAHRVVEEESGRDVTAEVAGPDGAVDLYGFHGLRAAQAVERRRVRQFDPADGARSARTDELIDRLSGLDQARLWATGSRVRVTADAIDAASRGFGEAVRHDDEVVSRIEERHAALEEAMEHLRGLRRLAMLGSTVALASAAAMTLVTPLLAVPLVLAAVAAVAATFVYQRRIDAGFRQEAADLEQVGAPTYLDFVVQRVDGLLAGSDQQQRMADVATDHREAAAAWTAFAGDAEVEWAFGHRREIETMALLRKRLRQHGRSGDDYATARAATLDMVAHLDRLHRPGSSAESFPVVLDDPFGHLAAPIRTVLLEVLATAPGLPQLVLLTEDEDLETWARIETPAGTVSLVAPQAAPAATPAEVVPIRRTLAG